MSEKPYKDLFEGSMTACLCITCLEEAAMKLKPVRSYELVVGPGIWPLACMTLRVIGATAQEHPFAPYINLNMDHNLKRGEWYISDGENAIGSEGC